MEDCITQELVLNPEKYEVSGSNHNASSNAPMQARTNAAKMVLLNNFSLIWFMVIFYYEEKQFIHGL